IDPKAIGERARAIVVNSPHNPTGYLMPKEVQAEMVRAAKARGAWLFSDEVYRGLEYDESRRLPGACDLYERAISLGVTSKSLGLAGLRIGWCATHDRELLGKLAAFKDYTTICSSGPSELFATIALRHHGKLVER